MKRILILAFVIPFVLYACFDDDPAEPENGGETSPYSGTFMLTSTGPESDCNMPAPAPGPTLQIVVSGDVIAINTVVGTWDEGTTSGTATSSETCVPIPDIAEDCVRCFYYTFDIQYSHPDTFAGTYTVIYEHSVECEVGECYTTYAIEGVR